ncbi:MAG: anthranilate phosphoribosyltransferase [Gammaproteobacteria bacterium]
MTIDAKFTLNALLNGEDLSESDAGELMRLLTDEDLPQAMSAGLLIALRAKGETPAEVRGFAKAMRNLARATELPAGITVAADVVGTGGDGSGSVNISTGTGLLTAACGVPVVKHGNRSVSSKSGSSDVLEALGVPLPDGPESAMQCLETCGFTFLFAPYFHPAMKAIAPVRGAMGVRTVFNILGPLTNPAKPPYNLIGAFDIPTARLMADTLSGMDIERAFVIHGEPGWDEATPCGPFTQFDVSGGTVTESRRDPAEFGIARCDPSDLTGGDAAFNARALEAVLSGEERGAHRDALVLGAALVLELTGRTASLREGIERAGTAIDDGSAQALLEKLRGIDSAG